MIVAKFGGACVSSGGMFERIAGLLKADRERKAVVVSAVAGVTDALHAALKKPRKESEIAVFVEKLRRQHAELLPPDDKEAREWVEARATKLERLLFGITYTEELTPRTRDLILSFGERLSAAVVAGNVRALGVEATPVEADALGLLCDEEFGNATAKLPETERAAAPKLRNLIEAGQVPVVTGYFGITPEGHIATFGRGGSDYSAAVVGYALKARTVEIWKEVDGFLSADPGIVPGASVLPRLSYDEAAELAYFGAKVLHPRAVQPARERGARLVVKNILRPKEPGTVIDGHAQRNGTIKSVSFTRDLSTLKVFATGGGYREGAFATISGALQKALINIYSATTSQTCVAFLVDSPAVPLAKKVLKPLVDGMVESIEVLPDVALVCAVGEGIGYTKGVAARVFRAVAAAGVNVQLISAGASMVAFHFTVDAVDLEKAVRAVHDEFFGPVDEVRRKATT